MNQHFEKLLAALRRGHQFVTHDVWHIGRPGEEVPKGFIIKNVRVVILLVGNLSRGTVMLRASALTFATILAIVPTLAILFYSVRTFHLDEAVFTMVQDQVEGTVQNVAEFFRGDDDNAAAPVEPADAETVDGTQSTSPEPSTDSPQAVVPQPLADSEESPATTTPEEPEPTNDSKKATVALQDELHRALFRDVTHQTDEQIDPVKEVFRLANDLADRAASDPSALFVSGIVLFLTTVLGLLRNIENAFNTIWGVRRTRPWYRMVGDYLLITILLPFVAAAVLGVNAALQSEEVLDRLGPLAVTVRAATQYAVIWLIFTALYLVVPNTRVKTRYALLGGIVAGTLWVLLSWAYVQFQIGLTNYNLVFSTLAQFPMLLMWIYSSWMILLFGVELTHAYQNEHTFALERFAEDASFAYREAVALRA
ncbi:MAG: YihY/virulence factor BrkB family protein, partial [Candidatus Hydrogenedentota bacterium]